MDLWMTLVMTGAEEMLLPGGVMSGSSVVVILFLLGCRAPIRRPMIPPPSPPNESGLAANSRSNCLAAFASVPSPLLEKKPAIFVGSR